MQICVNHFQTTFQKTFEKFKFSLRATNNKQQVVIRR